MSDVDDQMSDDEGKKRSRSKFASEREDEGGEVTKDSSNNTASIPHHVVKRPRMDFDNIPPRPSVSEDDFTALLQKHEKQKHMSTPSQEQHTVVNNSNNNNTNNNNNNRNNNKNKNNNNKNNNKPNNRNNNPKDPNYKTHNRPNNNNQINNRNNNNRNNRNNNNNNNKQRNNKQYSHKPITIDRFEKELASLSPTEENIAEKITFFLHETNSGLITVIVSVLGVEGTLKYVRETAKIEESGGMMTSDKYRRRSPGGCFFYLVKEGVSAEHRKDIFTDERGKRSKMDLKAITKKQTKKQNNKNNNNNNNTTTSTNTTSAEPQPNTEENNNENNNKNTENNNTNIENIENTENTENTEDIDNNNNSENEADEDMEINEENNEPQPDNIDQL